MKLNNSKEVWIVYYAQALVMILKHINVVIGNVSNFSHFVSNSDCTGVPPPLYLQIHTFKTTVMFYLSHSEGGIFSVRPLMCHKKRNNVFVFFLRAVEYLLESVLESRLEVQTLEVIPLLLMWKYRIYSSTSHWLKWRMIMEFICFGLLFAL